MGQAGQGEIPAETSALIATFRATVEDLRAVTTAIREQDTVTRLVGALIMSHSDDDGLVLPPKIAPQHVVILPIYRKGQDEAPVRDYCKALKAALSEVRYGEQRLRVLLDDRDLRGGEKTGHHFPGSRTGPSSPGQCAFVRRSDD